MNKTIRQSYIKQFKVVSRSQNTNSFGLYGLILVARDGEAWEVGANHLNVKDKNEFVNQVVTVDVDTNGDKRVVATTFPQFEIPRKLEKCPADVLAEIFQDEKV